MSVAFKSLKPGDLLYDCHRHKLGNTTIPVMGVWKVRVLEVNLEDQKALISWNGNTPTWKSPGYFQSAIIRRFPPEWATRDLGEQTCCMCHAKKSEGHRPDCGHPKAKKAPTHKQIVPGTKVKVNGFEGSILRQYDGALYEVRLDSGNICVDIGDITLVDVP